MSSLPRSHAFHLVVAIFVACAACPSSAAAATSDKPLLKAHFELGYLASLSHRIQFGKDGTYFSYVQSGGQDNLYAVQRLSLDFRLSARSTLIFLYQPLALETKEMLDAPLRVDGLDFPAGTPMRFFYGFPFYRVSYLRDLSKNPATELAIGLSLQIRNATIEFESLDGSLFRSNRNIGPVPILKLRWRHTTASGFWYGAEADGFYAPVSYINGSENEVIGAILDASLRAGITLKNGVEAFLNVRYLGGGAVGTDKTPDPPSVDGYVRNWLHFLTLTAGFSLGLF